MNPNRIRICDGGRQFISVQKKDFDFWRISQRQGEIRGGDTDTQERPWLHNGFLCLYKFTILGLKDNILFNGINYFLFR